MGVVFVVLVRLRTRTNAVILRPAAGHTLHRYIRCPNRIPPPDIQFASSLSRASSLRDFSLLVAIVATSIVSCCAPFVIRSKFSNVLGYTIIPVGTSKQSVALYISVGRNNTCFSALAHVSAMAMLSPRHRTIRDSGSGAKRDRQ